jgi:hypothetical protein
MRMIRAPYLQACPCRLLELEFALQLFGAELEAPGREAVCRRIAELFDRLEPLAQLRQLVLQRGLLGLQGRYLYLGLLQLSLFSRYLLHRHAILLQHLRDTPMTRFFLKLRSKQKRVSSMHYSFYPSHT